jgi:large subunit ribosomal protein L4
MATMIFTATGAKSTMSAKLDKAVFGVEVKNHDLLRSAYEAYLSNGRLNLAKTKTRGQVRGSTIKPWRQKGTGRARFGSRYNPIWRGGGIVFGPTGSENYTKNLNTKSKRLALRQALSLKSDVIKVIETFECKDGKVSQTAKLLQKLETSRNTLIVVSLKDGLVDRATRNLPDVKAVQANYLNVYDILNADNIVISKQALEIINNWLSDKPADYIEEVK